MPDFAGLAGRLDAKYRKEYTDWFLGMVARPAAIVEKSRLARESGKQTEYLLTILSVSVFLGVTLGALIPYRPAIQSRATVFVVVSFLWLFLSILVHFCCKLLGGKEDSQTTMSLMLQNLAFAYVVSNFLTLLGMWLLITYGNFDPGTNGDGVSVIPGTILFLIQFLVLFYLVPTTISYAHGFHGFKWFVVAVVAACFAVLFGFPVYAQHSC